jgi:alkylhydroperoxidase family enzyme
VPWIRQVSIDEAKGALKEQFDRAVERAGRVWGIVHVMSLNPAVLDSSMRHYVALMHGESPLSRSRRELLAVVTSAEIGCRY